ncbi:Aldehyde dehydrogenase [Vanrija pseudolonga]|uniref:Aldehyde dehydrogenase n=1 Tax=Vanrija pseudolonga TaxID=143232 RepID=A0AAF0Y6P2_9TREE|nr:Aldehyde dehydrogenase [Vanrija pseudolonga]
MAAPTFTHTFDHAGYKGTVEVPLGLYIDGKYSVSVDKNAKTIPVVNPTTGEKLVDLPEGLPADVDRALDAARKAYDTKWGLNVPGFERGKLLLKLADLMDRDIPILASLEALDNGKTYAAASLFDAPEAAGCFRYYAGWADKIHGKVIETSDGKLIYTRHEPVGVAGQIIPWNFPLLMFAWKLAPALAVGCTIVIKPSELTPLTAQYMTKLIKEAGFPDGVVNVVNGYGATVGNALSSSDKVDKVAFTGSTAVGRKVLEEAAKSNLKKVTLELGGKGANIIFDDANLADAVKYAAQGIFFNHGQTCCAGSRLYVQRGIYDAFMERFVKVAQKIKVGDPFGQDTFQGPQVSQTQYDRIMNYIECGKQEGAQVITGGARSGKTGFFIEPTIFSGGKKGMKIVEEEIFGPVIVAAVFDTEEEVIKLANDNVYGLSAGVFTQNITKGHRVANKLHAGTVWVNCFNELHSQVPFGGYKSSGLGRELGEYALENYTEIKAVHVRLTPYVGFVTE